MADSVTGKIPFVAAGVAFTLQFSVNAIVALEDVLDKSIIQIPRLLLSHRMGPLRAAFWAGLQEHHPGITLKDAGELIPKIEGDKKALQLVGEAIEAAFPTKGEGGDAGGDARPPLAEAGQDGTGPTSSPAGAN